MIESSDTPTRILDAAESLFADQGFEGVSVREITRAAGVNVAAVHYHFGSKESVLRGVTDRVAGPINARRQELMTALETETPTTQQLLDAFVRADIEVLISLQERGPHVARFLGRIYGDQTPWIQEMAAEQYAGSSQLLAKLAATLPHLSEEEFAWRRQRVVAVVVHRFATWPLEGMNVAEAEIEVGRLVAFLSAGLEAGR